jgi:hypothetical protein
MFQLKTRSDRWHDWSKSSSHATTCGLRSNCSSISPEQHQLGSVGISKNFWRQYPSHCGTSKFGYSRWRRMETSTTTSHIHPFSCFERPTPCERCPPTRTERVPQISNPGLRYRPADMREWLKPMRMNAWIAEKFCCELNFIELLGCSQEATAIINLPVFKKKLPVALESVQISSGNDSMDAYTGLLWACKQLNLRTSLRPI